MSAAHFTPSHAPSEGPPPWRTVAALHDAFGRLYNFLMVVACLLLLVMVASITVDVLLRNVDIPTVPRGFPASNDISEYALYLCTLLAAPWLLRAGQHIRVDIVLRAIPARAAWVCEWVSDILAATACATLAWVGVVMTYQSYTSDALQIKSIVVPEWWIMAALPLAFALLAIEFGFRMWRLSRSPRSPRADAVSAS